MRLRCVSLALASFEGECEWQTGSGMCLPLPSARPRLSLSSLLSPPVYPMPPIAYARHSHTVFSQKNSRGEQWRALAQPIRDETRRAAAEKRRATPRHATHSDAQLCSQVARWRLTHTVLVLVRVHTEAPSGGRRRDAARRAVTRRATEHSKATGERALLIEHSRAVGYSLKQTRLETAARVHSADTCAAHCSLLIVHCVLMFTCPSPGHLQLH